MYSALKTIAALSLGGLLLVFSSECACGVRVGIELCLNTLIPSLFPFMALSSFVVKSGIASRLERVAEKPMRAIFGLSGATAPVLLLSLIGGYPVGARGINALYKTSQISQKEAECAAGVFVCSGAGFVMNFIGAAIYNSALIGLIMLISQIISVFILGLIAKPKKAFEQCVSKKPVQIPLGSAVVEAAIDSSKGIFVICGFVVLFSSLAELIKLIPFENLKSLLLYTLEVCTAIKTASGSMPVELIAFIAGFGGICVHFQIFSSLEGVGINKLKFFFYRIIQGGITALLTHFGLKAFSITEQTFSTAPTPVQGGSIISCAVLAGLMLCFLHTVRNNS